MPRGKSSGISLSNHDASIVLGMVARDDREHDIAAWFGVNQGRVAEVKTGSYGTIETAPAHELPPKGPPGPKGRRLRLAVKKAVDLINKDGAAGLDPAMVILREAQNKYDANEA